MSNQETSLKVKDCKGCLGSNYCNLNSRHIDDQGNENICPCSTCLIKGICEVVCYDFRQYCNYRVNGE